MTSNKRMRTGESMSFCRWDMSCGPDLVLSCSKEGLVVVLSCKVLLLEPKT